MRCPVNQPYRITTPYGQVPGYPLHDGFHTGIDYVSDDRKNLATLNGKVTAIGVLPADGNYIVVEGDENGKHMRCWYAHNKTGSILVKVGQLVKSGQQLATMGMTGTAVTGVHLHFGLRVDGVRVDPAPYIKDEENDDMKVDLNVLQGLYRWLLGIPPTDAGKEKYIGKDYKYAEENIKASLAFQKLEKEAQAGEINAKVHLPKELR